jgi:RNA-binding protein 26
VGIPEDSVPLNPTPYYNNSNNNNNNSNSIVLPTHTSPVNMPSITTPDKRVVVPAAAKGPAQPSAAVELGPSDAEKRTKGFNPNFNSSFNPNFKSQTTLLITNIPPDLNSIDKLNSHFKKFGTVVNLQVKFAANKAYVQYTTHAEAVRAMRAVDAVLGNRFIKVFWAHRPDEPQPGATSPTGAVPPKPEGHAMKPKPEAQEIKPIAPTPVVPAPAVSAAAKELQERRQQQIEQYKKLLDMMSNKLKTVGPKEKEELLSSMRATTSKLEEMLKKEATTLQTIKQQTPSAAKPVASPAPVVKPSKAQKEKERLDRELDQISTTSPSTLQSSTSSLTSSTSSLGSSSNTVAAPTTSTTPATTPASANLAHLQQLKNTLEQTVISMGLDASSARGGRGRGRGRGAPRGRGRGRGSGGAPGGGGMSLDNRTSTVMVSSLPIDLRTENTLRIHFQPFGEVKGVVFQGDNSALVQFANRRSAEAAFSQGRQYKTQSLHMSWHDPAKPAAAAATNTSTPTEVMAGKQEDEETGTETQHRRRYEEEEEDEDDEDSERSWKH